MRFFSTLEALQKQNNSLLCVGLDSDIELIPAQFKKLQKPQLEFNKWIIDQTASYVCAYKPNSAFYESRGSQGISELQQTIEYIHKKYSDIPVILDGKRADIGNTSGHYAKYAFEYLKADAVTVNPYMGLDSLAPFLSFKEKGIFILCKTSNPTSGEIQDLLVKRHPEHALGSIVGDSSKIPLYQHVALKTFHEWNYNRNCALVVGATYPDELVFIREIVKDMVILVPGVGNQGGDLEKTLQAGLTADGRGLIINSSRGIIFSKNPKEEAENINYVINKLHN